MVVAERQPKTREYKTEPGPIEQRKVRDVLFIIMFVVVWIGMFVVAGLAIKNGNTKRLRYGRDYLGNLCGDKTSITLGGSVQTFDFTNSKYLYYVDVGFVDNPEPICVKTCPKFSNVTAVKIDDIIDEQYKAPKLASEFAVNRTLPEPYYDVQSISYRCVPISGFKYSWNNTLIPKFGNSDEASNSQNIVMGDVNARDALSSIWETLDESIIYIAISLLIGTALSFLFLLVIQVFGDAVVWITLVVTNVVFFALGAFFLVNWKAAMNGTTKLYSNSLVNSSIQNKNIMLGTGIASVVIGFLMLCMTLFLRKRIALAIELIDQGSKAMRAIPSLLLVPLFKYVILMGVFAWSLFIMSLLSSSGELISQAVVSGSSRVAAKYQPNQVLNYLQIFYFFGTMWTFEFIIAIAQCITAGAVAQWYWTMDKKNFPKGMLGKSVARTLKYHLGSLALGSFLIASLKTVRALLQYAQYQSKKTKSKIVQNALSVLACCIVCFEMFLKFLNTNAYIEVLINLFRLRFMDLAFAKLQARHSTCYGEMR